MLWLAACSSREETDGDGVEFDAGLSFDAGGDSAPAEGEAGVGSAVDQDASVIRTEDAARGCEKGTYTAKARPLDMFILLDQSGSMQEDEDRWTPVTKALKGFVNGAEVAGIGVALQYFPLGTNDDFKCQSKSYETPDVAMASLPQNASAIVSSIDAHYFSHDQCCDTPEHAGTPTRPAMEGAVAYMRGYIQKNPEHVGVILLATDGEPSSVCADNKAERVAQVVKGAAAHRRSALT